MQTRWLVLLLLVFSITTFAQSSEFFLQKILGQATDGFPSSWGKPIKGSENQQLFEPARKKKQNWNEIYVYQKEGITLTIGFVGNKADTFSVHKISPGQDYGERKALSEEEISQIITANAPKQKWRETLKTTNGIVYINKDESVTYYIANDKTMFSMKLASTNQPPESAWGLRPPSP